MCGIFRNWVESPYPQKRPKRVKTNKQKTQKTRQNKTKQETGNGKT